MTIVSSNISPQGRNPTINTTSTNLSFTNLPYFLLSKQSHKGLSSCALIEHAGPFLTYACLFLSTDWWANKQLVGYILLADGKMCSSTNKAAYFPVCACIATFKLPNYFISMIIFLKNFLDPLEHTSTCSWNMVPLFC